MILTWPLASCDEFILQPQLQTHIDKHSLDFKFWTKHSTPSYDFLNMSNKWCMLFVQQY